MLSKAVTEILNRQVQLEAYSSFLYMQMSAWCAHKGLEGCSAFLLRHAAEEQEHMKRLFTYVAETGALAVIGGIAAPPTEWQDVGEVFRKTFEHEKHITRSVNELVKATFDEGDYSTFNFLQWYVAEQHEEERLFQSILDKMQLIELKGHGLFMFDREVGGMNRRARG